MAAATTTAWWAWAEAACEAYRSWFGEHGLFDDSGAPRVGQEQWARLEARAAAAEEALGLSPQAMAKLRGALSVTAMALDDDGALEALRRAGAEILAARGLLAAGPDGGEAA